MVNQGAFFAYASQPSEAVGTIRIALARLRDMYRVDVHGWEQNDIAGRFLVDPILTEIERKPLFIADISRPNFNVIYEVGFAIGKKRRVALVKNKTIAGDEETIRELGVFDTLGYLSYANADELTAQLRDIDDLSPLKFGVEAPSNSAPVYIVRPPLASDDDIRVVSRVKKARLMFRSFDPQELKRLSAYDAIENVALSHGVIVSLVSSNRTSARTNNLRAAFVAGLAAGMGKVLLMLQEGDEPVPLDYRDLVSVYRNLEQINDHIAAFAADVTGSLQAADTHSVSFPKSFLSSLNLGAPAAGNEHESLSSYFMQTDEFRRTMNGEAQVVIGRKGSGKTAMFLEVRNRLRATRTRIVVDLRPEGFQLRKFRDVVVQCLEAGTREHTIPAFWEYVLLLEVRHKILQKDRQSHINDHTLYEGAIH